jgi:hypothetical protein
VEARNLELGRLAAFEYEAQTNDLSDYTSSVKRFYQRGSLVSTLTPMMLLVQIKLPHSPNEESKSQRFIASLTSKCLQHGIDGIVIQESDSAMQTKLISSVR